MMFPKNSAFDEESRPSIHLDDLDLGTPEAENPNIEVDENTLKEAALHDLNELAEDLSQEHILKEDDIREIQSRVEYIRNTLYSTFE